MIYVTETYTAEGWVRNATKSMSESSVRALVEMAKETPADRITEEWALDAADQIVGAVGVGPQFGQERVISIPSWRYFRGFAA